MKILRFEKKRNFLTLRVENSLDLWHLKNLIEKGDLVSAKTRRNIFMERDGKREKLGKRPVFLSIKVDKVEFKKYGEGLRVIGKIVECPDEIQKGGYHSIEIKVGTSLNLEKREWKEEHLKRIERAKVRIGEANRDLSLIHI